VCACVRACVCVGGGEKGGCLRGVEGHCTGYNGLTGSMSRLERGGPPVFS
jgi:hypothetical protein